MLCSAPPSSLTSSKPHLHWGDTSSTQRYALSGKYASHSEFMNCVFRWNHWSLCIKLQKCLILPRRNGSVIADYKLTFHMPEEEKDQLRNFSLSREMVYNVFRQFLYDQESESDPMFIDPASLKMVLGNWGQEVYSETRKPVLGFFLVFTSH